VLPSVARSLSIPSGSKPFVPLITVPVTITAAGQLLVVFGQFTLSSRRDDSQGYPGFPHPYTAGGMLLLTASDPNSWLTCHCRVDGSSTRRLYEMASLVGAQTPRP
jgi:hypothetical protein